MNYCGNCGFQLADGNAFCPECGRPVGAPPSRPSLAAKAKRSGRSAAIWIGGFITAVLVTLLGAYAVAVWGPSDEPEDPFRVSAQWGNPTSDCVYEEYVVPVNADDLISWVDTTQWRGSYSELVSLGAIHAPGSAITLVLEGTDDSAAVLTSMDVEIVERRAAIEGVVPEIDAGGCGGITPRTFRLDTLDTDPVRVTALDGMTEDGISIPAVSFPYTVANDDPEIFEIEPRVTTSDVDFRILLHWIFHGKVGTTTVDDHGQPFRISGEANARTVMFECNLLCKERIP